MDRFEFRQRRLAIGAKGVSQAKVATVARCSHAAICLWEQGKRGVSDKMLARLTAALEKLERAEQAYQSELGA